MGGKSLTLFGSVARDQAKEGSDADFLVEFSQMEDGTAQAVLNMAVL